MLDKSKMDWSAVKAADADVEEDLERHKKLQCLGGNLRAAGDQCQHGKEEPDWSNPASEQNRSSRQGSRRPSRHWDWQEKNWQGRGCRPAAAAPGQETSCAACSRAAVSRVPLLNARE